MHMHLDEDDRDSAMESSMDDLSQFEEEVEGMVMEALNNARKMGKLKEKASTFASTKMRNILTPHSINSAIASVKSTGKRLNSNKVHPS